MRSILIISVCVIVGCVPREKHSEQEAAVQRPNLASSNPLQLVGNYYKGDGTGYNLTLTLEDNGNFRCKWTGCLGVYGSSTGMWRLNGNQIDTETSIADGMLEDKPIGTLTISEYAGTTILVQNNDREFFDKNGPSRDSCFSRVEDK